MKRPRCCPRTSRDLLVERIVREASGLGPLEALIEDQAVEEVIVNGCDRVYVERAGRLERVDVAFESEEQLRNTIERILAPLGRRVDELSPMADARLPDGSRVNVVIPPLAVDGPALSIRRFPSCRPGPEDLVETGTLDRASAELLKDAVRSRKSILISGGTGSGKTTLLNALAAYHRLRGSNRHDRGRGRTPPRSATCGQAGVPTPEHRRAR